MGNRLGTPDAVGFLKDNNDSDIEQGVIIEWHLFHDVRDIIITSQTDVREMIDDDDDPYLSTFS